MVDRALKESKMEQATDPKDPTLTLTNPNPLTPTPSPKPNPNQALERLDNTCVGLP